MAGYCIIWRALWAYSGCGLPDITLGSWAEWGTMLVAVAALAAAIVAGFYSASQAKSSKAAADIAVKAFEEDAKFRVQAQARKVYTTVGDHTYGPARHAAPVEHGITYDAGTREPSTIPGAAWQYRGNVLRLAYTVHNTSDELIGPIAIHARDELVGASSSEGVFYGALLPGEKFEVFIVVAMDERLDIRSTPPSEAALGWGPVLRFQDTAGEWWERVGNQPIKHLDGSPLALPSPA